MIELKSYRDLTVWQKSMDLVVICYQLTSQFPKTEIYGLTSQIQKFNRKTKSKEKRVNFFDFRHDT